MPPKGPFDDGDPYAEEEREEKAAEHKEASEREELLDMQRALQHDYVRRTLFRIVEDCGVFRSIWDPSGKIHYNSGRQDLGQEIMRRIGQADPHLLRQMLSEVYSRQLKESTR